MGVWDRLDSEADVGWVDNNDLRRIGKGNWATISQLRRKRQTQALNKTGGRREKEDGEGSTAREGASTVESRSRGRRNSWLRWRNLVKHRAPERNERRVERESIQ